MANNGNGTALENFARALGWFSIGLGVAELVAPGIVGKLIGVRERRGLVRTLGVREIASGVGILTQRQRSSWVWSRVAGDAMDLALLGGALAVGSTDRSRTLAATTAVAGVAACDVLCAQELSRKAAGAEGGIQVKSSIIVNRSPEEVYRFWRDYQNLPRFMTHLHSVQMLEGNRSHWAAKGPAGTTVEWDAELTADRPNEIIAWRSLEGADVDNTGVVKFEPATGNRGTVIRVELSYNPPAGKVGATVAKLLGQSPEKQIRVDLLHLKQLLETGEIVRTEGQPAGRARSTSMKFDEPVRA